MTAALRRAGSPSPACRACCTRAALQAALRALCAAGGQPEPGADAGAQAEGKRKGPARFRLPAQSARGLGAAPRLRRRVPRGSRFATAARRLRVPFPMRCALMRWRSRHGIR